MNPEEILVILNNLFAKWGYFIIFFGSLIEITPFGWAVPGGGILLLAGFLANLGTEMDLAPVIATGTLGAWAAFILAYFLGRKTGAWLINKLHQEKNALMAKSLLENHGGMILTTSMLANLTRFWISYVAGIDRYSFPKFSVYAFVASLSWVSLMVLVGYFAGYEVDNLRKLTNGLGILAWVLLLVSILVIYRYIRAERKVFVESEAKELE